MVKLSNDTWITCCIQYWWRTAHFVPNEHLRIWPTPPLKTVDIHIVSREPRFNANFDLLTYWLMWQSCDSMDLLWWTFCSRHTRQMGGGISDSMDPSLGSPTGWIASTNSSNWLTDLITRRIRAEPDSNTWFMGQHTGWIGAPSIQRKWNEVRDSPGMLHTLLHDVTV